MANEFKPIGYRKDTPVHTHTCTCGESWQCGRKVRCAKQCDKCQMKTQPLTKDVVLQWPDFDNWWEVDGRFFDPDTDDVPWFDKRKFLAEYAFNRAKQFIKQTAARQTEHARPKEAI